MRTRTIPSLVRPDVSFCVFPLHAIGPVYEMAAKHAVSWADGIPLYIVDAESRDCE